jgi:hypothetical protein
MTRVCKPCWELKYCPYGPLVEQSPMLPSLKEDAAQHRDHLATALQTGTTGSVRKLTTEDRARYTEWLADETLLLRQAVHQVEDELRIEEISKIDGNEEKIRSFLSADLPPIHIYRASFDIEVGGETKKDDFLPEIWQRIQDAFGKQKKKYTDAFATGIIDDRKPLDSIRSLWFESVAKAFDPDDHPPSIPQEFTQGECNIFGHVCPVFFAAEAMTETSESRRMGRRPIPFSTMMRIVRRDDYRCQHCKKKLRDDEVEFDHKIPISKGGSSEEHNLRLTCFKCNRDKSDDYEP